MSSRESQRASFRRRLPLLMASLVAASCVSVPVDPTANIPMRASESRSADETAPAAIGPVSSRVPADERAPHAATSMMISPLSRVERTAGAPALVDVRIDAVDSLGEPVALAGDMRVVLKAAKADPCYLAFDIPLATKRQVERRFDVTLSQYVLRLQPEWDVDPTRGDDIVLTATLTTLDGKVLESTSHLAW